MLQTESTSLKSNSLGWAGQLFQGMAHMAPALAMIGTAPFMASRAGSALPLAFVLATLLSLMLAYCLGQLTKKYFGASGYFQIHSQALGSKWGFITSWLFFIYEPLNVIVATFIFGVLFMEPFSAAHFGFTIPWWSTVLIGNILTVLLSLKDIKNSIRITAVLGIIEFVVVIVMAVVLVVKADDPVQPFVFMPSASADGMGGLIFAFIFGFMAFVGFESGLPLTEETKDTRASTFKGLMWSVLVTGLFYIFIGYASVVGFGGGEDSAAFAKNFSSAADPYGSTLATKAYGVIGPWLLFFAALNSTIACSLASHNASTRVFFSLGRAGILPRTLGTTMTSKKIPVRASLFAGVITFVALLLLIALVNTKGTLVDWVGFMALVLTLPLLCIHFVTCVSVYVAYRHKHPGEFNKLHHGVLPLMTGLFVLVPIWGAVYYNASAPMRYAPYVVLVWFIIGIVLYEWMHRKHPEAINSLDHETDH